MACESRESSAPRWRSRSASLFVDSSKRVSPQREIDGDRVMIRDPFWNTMIQLLECSSIVRGEARFFRSLVWPRQVRRPYEYPVQLVAADWAVRFSQFVSRHKPFLASFVGVGKLSSTAVVAILLVPPQAQRPPVC